MKLESFAGGLLLLVAFFSCSKGSAPNNVPVAPTNLQVSATVSTDSSGKVQFTATATNAASYDFDFGNGSIQTVPSGTVTYKYTASGKYDVKVIAKSTAGLTISYTLQVNVGVKLSLVWSDEFDTAGAPNPSKWGYDLGGGGWGNNELENYTSRTDNVLVSNGTLKIIAKKESYNGSSYTAARLLTKGLYSFQYGKIEIMAKLPAAQGTWPGLWMLGNNINTVGWPACGEIDIMEQNGSAKNTIYGTMHYPSQQGQYGDGSTTTLYDASTSFHKYSAIWTTNSIQLLVDDMVFYTLANKSSFPFNQPFFIIFNVAMGGNFGGTVDPNFTQDQMEIDYIRVYQ